MDLRETAAQAARADEEQAKADRLAKTQRRMVEDGTRLLELVWSKLGIDPGRDQLALIAPHWSIGESCWVLPVGHRLGVQAFRVEGGNRDQWALDAVVQCVDRPDRWHHKTYPPGTSRIYRMGDLDRWFRFVDDVEAGKAKLDTYGQCGCNEVTR